MERIKEIQGLRALAFMTIFLGHASIVPGFATVGVPIFIMLSGFCLYIRYSGGGYHLIPRM